MSIAAGIDLIANEQRQEVVGSGPAETDEAEGKVGDEEHFDITVDGQINCLYHATLAGLLAQISTDRPCTAFLALS